MSMFCDNDFQQHCRKMMQRSEGGRSVEAMFYLKSSGKHSFQRFARQSVRGHYSKPLATIFVYLG